MTEQWKPINGFAAYAVSNAGRVRRLKSGRVLQTFKWGQYPAVNLYSCGVMYKRTLHTLVANAFVLNPQNLPEVNHLDGIKAHCQSGNLEWRTHAGNMQHAAHHNLQHDGVSFCPNRNKWKVSYRAGGVKKFIGYFKTYTAAIQARQTACLNASIIF